MFSNKPFDGIDEDNNNNGGVGGDGVDLVSNQSIDGSKTFTDLRVSSLGTFKLEDVANIGAGILGCNAGGFVVKHTLGDSDNVVLKNGLQNITGKKLFTGGIDYYSNNDIVFNRDAEIMTYQMINNAIVAGTNVEYCSKKGCVFSEGDQIINGVKKFSNALVVDKDGEFYTEKIAVNADSVPSAGWYSVAILDDNNPSVVDGVSLQQRGVSNIVYTDRFYNCEFSIEVGSIMALGIEHLKLISSYCKTPFQFLVSQMRLLTGANHTDGSILQFYFIGSTNAGALYNKVDYSTSGFRLVQPTTSQTSFTDYKGIVRTLVNGNSFTQVKQFLFSQSGVELYNGGSSFSGDVAIDNNLRVNKVYSTLDETTAPSIWNILLTASGFTGGSLNSFYASPQNHKEKKLVRFRGAIFKNNGNFSNGDVLISNIGLEYTPHTTRFFICSSGNGVPIGIKIRGQTESGGANGSGIYIIGTHNDTNVFLDNIIYWLD